MQPLRNPVRPSTPPIHNTHVELAQLTPRTTEGAAFIAEHGSQSQNPVSDSRA